MVAALAGILGRSYLAGAGRGWMAISAIGNRSGTNIGNINNLRDLGISDAKAVVELPNLKALEDELKKLGPKAVRQFKTKARRIGAPAVKSMRASFDEAGIHGPLGAPKRPRRNYDKMSTNYSHARLNWMYSRAMARTSKGIAVNYKNRRESKALRDLAAARDGTISIVRVIVRAPAYILADMAGKSNTARMAVGAITREYQQNLFGRGVVTRRHTITAARRDAIDDWMEALNQKARGRGQGEASRYAWPAMEKHMKVHKELASKLLNETINEVNARLNR